MKVTNYFNLICFTVFGLLSTYSANAENVIRNVGSFSKVEIAGPFNVSLVQSDKEQVEINTEKEAIEKIITKVEGSTLRIYYKEKHNTCCTIEVTISFKEINSLECSGAIDLNSASALQFKNLDLDLSGASKVALNVTCTQLNVDISGAGKVMLNGKAQKVELEISGSGNLSAPELEANDYEVEISGAGSAKVNATAKLNVAISGSGSVIYKGSPKIDQQISGSGSLKKMSE
jgi:hypothetical protein